MHRASVNARKPGERVARYHRSDGAYPGEQSMRVLALSMGTLIHSHARNMSSVALSPISYDIATWNDLPADPVLESQQNKHTAHVTIT
jgi:hypothetical protein